jgi:hypothetical protein
MNDLRKNWLLIKHKKTGRFSLSITTNLGSFPFQGLTSIFPFILS